MFVFSGWLQELIVQKLVVVIKRVDTNEVIERWQFDIQCDKTADEKTYVTHKVFAELSVSILSSQPL